MQKKAIFLILLILIAVIVVYFAFKPIQSTYSENPKDWIESLNQTTSIINTIEATAGQGTYEEKTQYLSYKGSIASFKYIGYYNGELFHNEYKNLIKIHETLTPNDGTADIFVVQTFENEKPVTYIFLDDDWNKKISETTVVWGEQLQYQKKMNLKQLQPGIYYDKISDDSRFYVPEEGPIQMKGGILIGNIDSKSFSEGKITDKIFIRQI